MSKMMWLVGGAVLVYGIAKAGSAGAESAAEAEPARSDSVNAQRLYLMGLYVAISPRVLRDAARELELQGYPDESKNLREKALRIEAMSVDQYAEFVSCTLFRAGGISGERADVPMMDTTDRLVVTIATEAECVEMEARE